MIVPSMNLEEIKKEINKDFPILLRKVQYVEKALHKNLTKKQRTEGFTKFFDYISKYKNHWIYKIHYDKKEQYSTMMLLYHTGKAHAAILVASEFEMLYHTSHFFKRYNERRNLGLVMFKDIIHVYMQESDLYNMQRLTKKDEGVTTIFGSIPSGIILGTFNIALNLYKINTYLPNEILSPNQTERLTRLNESVGKYMDSSGQLT